MIKGLQFFTRTSDAHRINLASWHSPHSLTWRWLIAWSRFKGDERRAHWRMLWWSRGNTGFQWSLIIPWVGRLNGQTQHPMWYRDLYMRLRDEKDHDRYERSSARFNAKIVAEAVAERGEKPLH